MPASLEDVRSYYDKNTPLFLRFGSSPETQTIHRSLWPKGILRLEDALAVSNNLVLEEAKTLSLSNPRIADLGCGVGATLFHVLAGLGGGRGVGVTLSAVQARLAESTRQHLSFSNLAFLQADFHHVPLSGLFDLVYSIEAFIHSQNPQEYLSEVSRLLKPGGRLILLDDFYVPNQSDYAQRWLKAYKDGWYVPNMQTSDETIASALTVGLTLRETKLFTPNLRLRALPDSLAKFVLWLGNKLPQNHPIVPSMLGSMALQQCLKAGWIEYRWLVFEKN
ncbi:MAG: class I SAM-dependent methyltransferase [Anaerolineales bacterium]|nr:class I SAM-dependent methyltransferase [Anaerolineales bacterium]